MSESIRSRLPPIYGERLPEFFDTPTIVEEVATCSRCAMCDHSAEPGDPADAHSEDLSADVGPVNDITFRPDVKCCSFHPSLPNYLVGATLSSASPSLRTGAERLRSKIAKRVGVTPARIAPPRKYRVLYKAAHDRAFGIAKSLRCPYFVEEGGLCSIWNNWGSICATWYCKHNAGAAGRAFWNSIFLYLWHSEATLSRYAIETIGGCGVEPDIPDGQLTLEDVEDQPPKDKDYASYWGKWVGREEEFYVECAKLVSSLTREQFAKIVDHTGGSRHVEAAAQFYEAITRPKLARNLVRKRDLVATAREDGVVVAPYNATDCFMLPHELYDALGRFRAEEATEDALERVQRETGLEIPESLLLEMQLFGVMTPPAPETPEADEVEVKRSPERIPPMT